MEETAYKNFLKSKTEQNQKPANFREGRKTDFQCLPLDSNVYVSNNKSQNIQRNRNVWPTQTKKKNQKNIENEKLDGGHTILRLFKNCLKDAQRTKRQGKTKKTKSKYQ